MPTNLDSDWVTLLRHFMGDDEEEYAYNETSLQWAYRIGALEAGYAITAFGPPPTISAAITPYTMTGLLLAAHAAYALLAPRPQLKRVSMGTPRRSFTFDGVDNALRRAAAFIAEHDSGFVLPVDCATDIQILENLSDVIIATVNASF